MGVSGAACGPERASYSGALWSKFLKITRSDGSLSPAFRLIAAMRKLLIAVEELFGDADEDHEQCIDARWKKSPVVTSNRKRVILARVGGKMVALAQPSAC
jgi:hypothetical protein